MSPLQYLTEEWRAEAERRLKSDLTPERMNHITASMSNVHLECPGGGSKYLLFRFDDGALSELALGTGDPPEAEFHITGAYDIFSQISRAELGAQKALMTGKLKLTGNMIKALKLAAVADLLNKVLAGIPAVY